MKFVDSHCHLNHLKCDHYEGGLDQLLQAARARDVEQFLSVAVNLDSTEPLRALADRHSDVFISAGVHPLQENLPPLPTVEELLEHADHPKVVAIGETGLDYYYSKETAEWQHESFLRHLQVARELAKPLIIHTREARQETLDMIAEHGNPASAGVLHCFTETREMAEVAMGMGYFISFSGIITFRNAEALREVVKAVPLDRILIETDAPWLAPVPYRGKQNEPQYVVEVAKCVAELKGESVETVAEVTTNNFRSLFNISAP